MGKKQRKPGKGKEKTERKTVKARRESKKVSIEDDIDAILASIQKEEAKKKEVHVEENVSAPFPRSNCTASESKWLEISEDEDVENTDSEESECGSASDESESSDQPGGSLRDLYRRTSLYWQMAAHEHTQHTGKELRKDGFDLAEGRYRELQPLLVELARLEEEQKAEEEQYAAASLRKKGKAKSKNASSQK